MSFDQVMRVRELKKQGFNTQEAITQVNSEVDAYNEELIARDEEYMISCQEERV